MSKRKLAEAHSIEKKTVSLRKTWGFHQRVSFGTDLPTLMVCFNHSTQKQTLDYLCVQPEEIRNVYEN